jgi:hypothetical protein
MPQSPTPRRCKWGANLVVVQAEGLLVVYKEVLIDKKGGEGTPDGLVVLMKFINLQVSPMSSEGHTFASTAFSVAIPCNTLYWLTGNDH